MASKVEEFEQDCLPDHILTDSLSFSVTSTLLDPEDEGTEELAISLPDYPNKYVVFNDWSRPQLLSMYGIKERWLSPVTPDVAAAEMNNRAEHLVNQRMRLMVNDNEDLLVLRGIVSKYYRDIPDSLIMRTLLELMPGSYATKDSSSKTDRAFYAHIISPDAVTLDWSTGLSAYPSVTIKNSEVGYTSLWVMPSLFLPDIRLPLVFETKVTLRRSHRGSQDTMMSMFEKAMQDCSSLWGKAIDRLKSAADIVYQSEDDAVAAMRSSIVACKGSKQLALDSEKTYRGKQYVAHTVEGVIRAILASVNTENTDALYTESSIAGAVLWRLT